MSIIGLLSVSSIMDFQRPAGQWQTGRRAACPGRRIV